MYSCDVIKFTQFTLILNIIFKLFAISNMYEQVHNSFYDKQIPLNRV